MLERSAYHRPPAHLNHVDVVIRFFEDHVEAQGTLHFTARTFCSQLELDDNGQKKIVPLSRTYQAGEKFSLDVSHTSIPDETHLEGIYRDVTPPDAPPQYMSQCQQFGFQRILPILDDCTAKATFHTTLEGDARYTHMISNGDCVSNALISPTRRRVVYENKSPMPPYLFLACAGTWDVLSDSVTYPDIPRTIQLEYLVPPNCTDAARVPMEILKKSILFQHAHTGYVYPYQTYRTICMTRSLWGGMENTGNTTIVTDAALINDETSDNRLLYAYSVIPHEFEHSHCGGLVTMETVFDMWLNEAYTINVERAFVAQEFGPSYMRMRDLFALRGVGGAYDQEDAHCASSVVRERVNHADEVVDAITYDKAPEVLNTLRNWLGEDIYQKCWQTYFTRFAGGNANTEDFLQLFSEVSGRDVARFLRPWLFEATHPTVKASHTWRAGRLTLTVTCAQDFTVPVPYAVVKNGQDVVSGTLILENHRASITLPCEKPDFISWNREGGFYGVFEHKSTVKELQAQVLSDPSPCGRIIALRELRDRKAFDVWTSCVKEIFFSESLDLGTKAALLSVSSVVWDRAQSVHVRENYAEMHELRARAAQAIGEKALLECLFKESSSADQTAHAIQQRALECQVLKMLAEIPSIPVMAAFMTYTRQAKNITTVLNGLSALLSVRPTQWEFIEAHGDALCQTFQGYLAWLSLMGETPQECVFDLIAREEARPTWQLTHPVLVRELYGTFVQNNEMLWTEKGLSWLETKLVEVARVSEYNAIRLLAPLLNYRGFEAHLRARVRTRLKVVSKALPQKNYPMIGARLEKLLKR